MTKEEIKEYLKENLTIDVERECDFGNNYSVVILKLEGECFSSSVIPNYKND